MVEPGQIAKIQVQSVPKELKNYKETIVIFISECEPKDRKGKPIILNVDGAVPYVNLENYDVIFKEAYIVDTFSDIPPENVRITLLYNIF